MAPAAVSRAEFDAALARIGKLEARVADLEAKAALRDSGAKPALTEPRPRLRQGTVEFTGRDIIHDDDMHGCHAVKIEFHNDADGNLVASGIVRRGPAAQGIRRMVHFEVWAYDGPNGTGEAVHEGFDIAGFAPGTTRVFKDVKFGKHPASAVRSVRFSL
jgi:hypothetical protein